MMFVMLDVNNSQYNETPTCCLPGGDMRAERIDDIEGEHGIPTAS
jgi:hypothetical protein